MKLRRLLCGFTLFLLVGAQTAELRAQFGGFGALFGRNQSSNDSDRNQQHGNRGGNNQQPVNHWHTNPITAGQLPDMDQLKVRIERVLEDYYSRPLNTRDNDSWEVMHSIVAYGVKSEVAVGGPQGERRNAIGWLCYNLPLRGPRMLTVRNGMPYAVRGVSVQGHYGQFLAILAQSRLMRNYPLLIDGNKFTIEDLIEAEKRTCISGEELTFKLIALSHYLPTDAQWQCERGQKWNISRLIREEIRQPITHSAACGGTHRLMGLAYAVRRREQQGKPIDGDFALARDYLQQYFDWTFSLQNPDGSFSTAWLARRENRPDIDRKIQCTGHITEWLVYALPKHELHNPQVIAAVDFLTTSLERGRTRDWKIGPLGHALHALAIYKERMFEGKEDRLPDDAATANDAVASSKPAAKDNARGVTSDAAKADTSATAATPRSRNVDTPSADSTAATSRRPQIAEDNDMSSGEAGTAVVTSQPEMAADDESASAVAASPLIVPSLDHTPTRSSRRGEVASVPETTSDTSAATDEAKDDLIPEYRPLTGDRPTAMQGGLPDLTPANEPVSEEPANEPAAGRLRIRMEAGPDLDEMPLSQPEELDEVEAPALRPSESAKPQGNQPDTELFRFLQPGSADDTATTPVTSQPPVMLGAEQVDTIGPAAGGTSALLLEHESEPIIGRQLPAQRDRQPVHLGRRPQTTEGPALIGPR